MSDSQDLLSALHGQPVVLDMSSQYVFVGTLIGHDQHYLILQDVDVHDLRDTATTRELYVVDAKRLGLRSNRKRVFVSRHELVSVSALDDVLD
jgi:hypothetical protein